MDETVPLHQKDSNKENSLLKGFGLVVTVCALVCLGMTVGLIASIYLGVRQMTGNTAVSTGNDQCNLIGMDVLDGGGSAVDAAVAAVGCLVVAQPDCLSLAGDGLMLVHNHKTMARSVVVDFRSSAPGDFQMSETFFQESGKEKLGLQVANPGLLDGLVSAHRRFGRLDFRSLFDGAVRLAEDGFVVSEELASAVSLLVNSSRADEVRAALGDDLFNVKQGEKLRLPRLASGLRQASAGGYDDALVEDILNTTRANNGMLKPIDFRNYSSIISDALQVNLSNKFTVESVGPPASGNALLMLLSMMDIIGYGDKDDDKISDDNYHRFLEAMKFSLAYRDKYGGDPAFESVNSSYGVSGIEEKMLNRTFLENEVLTKIKDTAQRGVESYDAAGFTVSPSGQCQSVVTVVDKNELFVSAVFSIGSRWGSQLWTKKYSILLNNQMLDFTLVPKIKDTNLGPSPANQPEPGKRPMTGVCPLMFFDNRQQCGFRFASVSSQLTNDINTDIIAPQALLVYRALWKLNRVENGSSDESFARTLLTELNDESTFRLSSRLFPLNVVYEPSMPSSLKTKLISVGQLIEGSPHLIGGLFGVQKVNNSALVVQDERRNG